jgi:hypothetical protein
MIQLSVHFNASGISRPEPLFTAEMMVVTAEAQRA